MTAERISVTVTNPHPDSMIVKKSRQIKFFTSVVRNRNCVFLRISARIWCTVNSRSESYLVIVRVPGRFAVAMQVPL